MSKPDVKLLKKKLYMFIIKIYELDWLPRFWWLAIGVLFLYTLNEDPKVKT